MKLRFGANGIKQFAWRTVFSLQKNSYIDKLIIDYLMQACFFLVINITLRKQKYHADEVSITVKTLHFGRFGSVDRFEPAKAFLREEGGT